MRVHCEHADSEEAEAKRGRSVHVGGGTLSKGVCVAVWGEAMGSASAMEEPWDHRVGNHLL